jgi:flagellin
MSLVVNTNVQSLNAQRNLAGSTALLGKALERLSSGLRINNASDDAAGLAISVRLGAQVRGLNQAIRNANDGAALLQTAEGALNEITNIVTRIKELAVQSANGTNSASDRNSLNAEVQALLSEVTRIATQTKFGSTALLDGSFSGTFQVGVEVGQTVSTSVGNFRASALSASVASQSLTFGAGVDSVGAVDANSYDGIDSSTDLQISEGVGTAFIRQTTAADDTSSAIEGAQSAIATAKAINESTSSTGVTASVTAATFTVADAAGRFANALDIDGTTNVLVVNGQAVIVNLNGGSQSARRQQLIDAVNSQVSGVTASAGAGSGDFTLTAADGRNISVRATGTGANTVGGELFGFTTAVSTESVVARGGITLQAGGDITTTFADAAQVTGEGTSTASGTPLSTVDISTIQGANTALLILDSVLDTISSARGDLGAVQNRLGSTIANLSIVVEKVSEARSRILDADFAQETATLTKAQILQQAGIAVLSQANAVPAAALALLKQ